ncbi:MAG: recombinase family protein [Eubacteriales bacterium]
MKNSNTTTAAAYIRVSTHDQEELSPDSQIRLIQDYCTKNRLHLPASNIFVDGGISGRKAHTRPEFQKMISLAKEKEPPFDVILVWKFSRFARNQEESIVYKTLLKKNNIDVVSISEPLIEGPFGSLIERIIEWMDEYYSIRLSSDVKRGMIENALRGAYQAPAPLGYHNINKSLSIVPEESEIVKLIFQKYIYENMGIVSIASLLNSMNIQTKRGRKFENRTIRYILQNPVYAGYVRWNVGRENLRVGKVSSPNMIIQKGNFEPIIPLSVFEEVQKKLSNNVHKKTERTIDLKGHWLSGLLKCSNCSGSLTYTHSNNGFQCINYSHGKCSVSHYVSANIIITAIIKTLAQQITNEFIYTTESITTKNTNIMELSLLNTSLENLKTKEFRIKEAYRNGIDTLEEYQEHKTFIATEQQRIKHSIASLSQDITNQDKAYTTHDTKCIKHVIDILQNDTYSKNEKSAALHSICEKIVYNKHTKSITIYCVYH